MNFPPELAALPHWVCWRLEPDPKSSRDAKVPYCPATGKRASSNNTATWGTLDEALYAKDKYLFSGIGFMFTSECGIIGIDIDHCLDNGQPNDTAAAILSKLPPTYIEISPSGRGIHIFLRGYLPAGGNKNTALGVEMYADKRYFTMTGNRWSTCTDTIADGQAALEIIHQNFIKTARKSKKSTTDQKANPLEDSELLDLARASRDKDDFNQLWDGHWQGKFKSQSEADFALCRKLAFWSGKDEGQIDRLFRQSGLFREKWDTRRHADGATYGEQTVRRACEMTAKCYTRPVQRESEIFEQGGAYYRNRNQKVYQLTNFVIQPGDMVVSEEESQLTCDLVTVKGETFHQVLMTKDFANLQRFKNVLNKNTIALTFRGSEGDLELLKEHIYELGWMKKKGVKALGIYPHRKKLVFVSPTGAVAAGGKPVNDIVQLEKYRALDSNIMDYPIITADQLQTLGKWLLSYNVPAKTIPVLAWIGGCFIKPHLKRGGTKYPHLFLTGEGGGGKSSTLEIVILPTFGRIKVVAAAQHTNFSLMWESCSSNIIPQAIDEFKPSRLDKYHISWLYNHFRDSYDYHEGIRGRADQTAVTYDLLAPIVVAGEESADETAIRERTIELLFSKKDLLPPEHLEALDMLSANADLLGSFGRGLLDAALRTPPAEVRRWYDKGKTLFSRELPSRIVNNLCCAYAGLCHVANLCETVGLSWKAVFPFEQEVCAGWLEYAAKEYLLDGGSHNHSVVEQTLEIMARMKLKESVDYAFENNGQYLCLHLVGIYDRYTRYRKDCAVAGEVLSYKDFRRQLSQSQFLIAKDKTKRFGNEVKRVWIVDYQRLQKFCDVSGFLPKDVEEGG